MLWKSFVIFFTLRPSDLITTLTYVLVDNFCPCFIIELELELEKEASESVEFYTHQSMKQTA